MVIVPGTVVTGITHHIAVSVFLPGVVMVGAVILTVRDTVTIKVRSAAGISIFIAENGRWTRIAAVDRAGTAGTGIGAGAEEKIITGIGVVDVDTDTKAVTFVIGTHVAVSGALGACRLVAW
jgi:hypothetical protein